MASGITLLMRNRRKPPPVLVHASGDGRYVNPARDLKPGRRLRPELRGLLADLGPEIYVEVMR